MSKKNSNDSEKHTSTKTGQQSVTSDVLSLWSNQLKICPLVLASNCSAPLWANQCNSEKYTAMQCIISPMFSQRRRGCVCAYVFVCVPSYLGWSDRQAGDLINQTENFISWRRDAERKMHANTEGNALHTGTRDLPPLIKVAFTHKQKKTQLSDIAVNAAVATMWCDRPQRRVSVR